MIILTFQCSSHDPLRTSPNPHNAHALGILSQLHLILAHWVFSTGCRVVTVPLQDRQQLLGSLMYSHVVRGFEDLASP